MTRLKSNAAVREGAKRRGRKSAGVLSGVLRTVSTGAVCAVWLRGLENIEKRYIIHVAGFNLGILVSALFGVGTAKGWADARFEALLAYSECRLCGVLAVWLLCGEQKAACPLIIRFELAF